MWLNLFYLEKPGPLSEAKILCLYREVLCLKSQIPSTKFQINHKFQYSMTKTLNQKEEREKRKEERGKRTKETTEEHE